MVGGDRIHASVSGPDVRTADLEGIRGLVWRSLFLIAAAAGLIAALRTLYRNRRSGLR